MRKLCVKLDRIAALRQLHDSLEPDPVTAAALCELNGADSISVRLKTEQGSIKPRDIKLLRQMIQTELNLEIPNRQDYTTLAKKFKPDCVTIIPAYQETNIIHNGLKINNKLQEIIASIKEDNLKICLLLDPDPLLIKQAFKLDIQAIELCIGNYAFLKDKNEIAKELKNIHKAAEMVHQAKLPCAAGHGINYHNIRALVQIKEISEFKIGYALVSRAIFTGLDNAVRDLRSIIDA